MLVYRKYRLVNKWNKSIFYKDLKGRINRNETPFNWCRGLKQKISKFNKSKIRAGLKKL